MKLSNHVSVNVLLKPTFVCSLCHMVLRNQFNFRKKNFFPAFEIMKAKTFTFRPKKLAENVHLPPCGSVIN